MRRITSLDLLEKLGKTRLSRHFFARDFLYSEIGNFHGMPNLPENVDLFLAAGAAFCVELLDPIVETFGPVAVRSAYRSPSVNKFGNDHDLKCARNEANFAGHIWDRRDGAGRMGACVSVVVPWFADQYNAGRDWRDLAWWVHDHLPYHEMWFFSTNAAFNLTWRQDPGRVISSYMAPRGKLLAVGCEPVEDLPTRRARYADFPAFRGISYPTIPARWAKAKD
ncbi:hypothetical protein ACEN2J_15540 [Pseudorhodobacter sp. W20_MBD10_FR17]|uniref:hypothetical protein n=1 Tax=Pseudorhodobacter sp. W20_MBD10_FR17 TaxID=3240266 RepID=UPI003F995911